MTYEEKEEFKKLNADYQWLLVNNANLRDEVSKLKKEVDMLRISEDYWHTHCIEKCKEIDELLKQQNEHKENDL